MDQVHWLKYYDKTQPWVNKIPKQKSYRDVAIQYSLYLLIHIFNKSINLRMSSSAHNEFGIQFLHKRLPNFDNEAGLSVRYNDLWNTTKSIKVVNKKSHCYISDDFL